MVVTAIYRSCFIFKLELSFKMRSLSKIRFRVIPTVSFQRAWLSNVGHYESRSFSTESQESTSSANHSSRAKKPLTFGKVAKYTTVGGLAVGTGTFLGQVLFNDFRSEVDPKHYYSDWQVSQLTSNYNRALILDPIIYFVTSSRNISYLWICLSYQYSSVSQKSSIWAIF